MTTIIKIVLTALFFLCLLDLPYGFFQLVRFAALIGFGVLAYQANENGLKAQMVIFICLALLFQPLIKISLGREIWNVLDVLVGIGLIVSIFNDRRQALKQRIPESKSNWKDS